MSLYGVKRGAVVMHTGTEIKTVGGWGIPGDNVDTWSCGCTVVATIAPLNARCLGCGGTFKKVPRKKSGSKRGKTESPKIELVESPQALFPEIEEKVHCQRCSNSGEIKVFTQEWDRIKSHMVPCPMCYSQEWLDWSAGKRIIEDK
jgi:Zn finger protein HypA/HybF involved in hydrogenase expression